MPRAHLTAVALLASVSVLTRAGLAEPAPPPPSASAAPPESLPAPSPAPGASTAVAPPAPAAPLAAGPPTNAAAPVAPALPASLVLTLPPPPTDAAVHLAVDYAGAKLEGRSRVDRGDWAPLCSAPCDRTVRVDGLDIRVTAPGMTPSNSFAVEPGPGIARFRVSGGSTTARTVGLAALISGLPVSFAGMALFALGEVNDERPERTLGIATLAVGAVVTLTAIPLLLAGSTTVKDAHNKDIATRATATPLF